MTFLYSAAQLSACLPVSTFTFDRETIWEVNPHVSVPSLRLSYSDHTGSLSHRPASTKAWRTNKAERRIEKGNRASFETLLSVLVCCATWRGLMAEPELLWCLITNQQIRKGRARWHDSNAITFTGWHQRSNRRAPACGEQTEPEELGSAREIVSINTGRNATVEWCAEVM